MGVSQKGSEVTLRPWRVQEAKDTVLRQAAPAYAALSNTQTSSSLKQASECALLKTIRHMVPEQLQ